MPAVLNGPKRHISFYGEDVLNPSKNFSFDVLAGDQPPQIVDGYAQWQTAARPLRRALTIFQGYNPIAMQVSVRFVKFDQDGSWAQDDDTGRLIEYEIAALEWFAGEGHDAGPPPFVWLSTFDGRGTSIPLIPFQYQPTAGNVAIGSPQAGWYSLGDTAPWVITSLQWDADPVRNTNGFRIRQDATLIVQYYQGPGPLPTRSTPSQRGKSTTRVSRTGADTAITIARSVHSRDSYALATAIKAWPQNQGLHIRSIYRSRIPHGKKVHIPTSY